MKNCLRWSVVFALVAPFVHSQSALAADSAGDENGQTTTTIEQTSSSTTNPCLASGATCGWAMLDSQNNVVNVIVCSYEVCGTGTFDGKTVVPQARPEPSGNVAGFNRGTYNPATNVFHISEGVTLVGGSNLSDVVVSTTTTTTVPESFTPQDEPVTAEQQVFQAGSRNTKTVHALKRTSIKKCVSSVAPGGKKCVSVKTKRTIKR